MLCALFQCLCFMAAEDFSFPAVHKSSSTKSIVFPPFWQLSPCTDSCHEDEEDHSTPVENSDQMKSFACVEGVGDDDQIVVGSHEHHVTHVHDQEEKMDMLWEDFNEELYPVRSTSSDYKYISGDMLRLGCVGFGAFNLSRSNAATTSSNPGVVLIVRVLKKLFFLHNSHHHYLKKPAKQ